MELSAVLAGGRTTMRAAHAFTDHLTEDLRAELKSADRNSRDSKRLACPDRRPIG